MVVAVLALAAFVPLTFLAISSLGPRRGVLTALLGGWLLLPWYDAVMRVPILTSKRMFVPAVVAGASLLLDGSRWRRLQPSWLDLPMLVWCATQFASATANGLGAWDGTQAVFEMVVTWGLPYLLGRVYLGDLAGMMDLAWSLVLAALAYVPLCLWEIRMSPQLQRMVYGFSTIENFGMTVRFGGYRPNVFLVHGLMLGMFMATSTLVAWWLWRTGSIRAFRGVTLGWICLVLAVTTVLCKSTGAVILLVVGLALLESTRWVRASILVAVLLSLAPAFGAARISGWTGRDLVVLSAKYINADRAQSLEYRAKQEDALISKAMQRPWFGWGRWGRSRVYNEDKYDISVTDSLWVIALGVSGLTGLISLGGVLLVPAAALVRRFPARTWRDPRLASAAALAVGLVLTAIDCLFNAMMTPIYPAIAGALVTFSRARLRPRSRPRPPGVEPPTRPIEPGVENHAS